MFDWLFEARQTVYLILGAVAVIAAAVWARSGFVFVREQPDRTKAGKTKTKPAWPILVLGVVIVLGLAYHLAGRFVETPHQQIERKLQEMAKAVKDRNVDRIFEHISDRFDYHKTGKAAFRKFVDEQVHSVDDLVIWDVKFPDETGKVTFSAKPKSSRLREEMYFRVGAEFVRDPDGQWRLATFKLYPPGVASQEELTIPGLP